jgi:alpha-galactosidase
MNRTEFLIIAGLLTLLVTGASGKLFALDNGLAKTPPMGWNTWNTFQENIDENKIKGIADAFVSSGMKDAGYEYIVLDDNWMANGRDASGNLRPDPTRFKSGMKALADYIHEKGLKMGIYGDHGSMTCTYLKLAGSGSYGKEVQDAKSYASWGVDYLKYDNCNIVPGSNQQKDYENMRDALAQCGRDIVYSICAWEFKNWMPATGNLWRTTGDINWTGGCNGRPCWGGIMSNMDGTAKLWQYAKPGQWNDPDMLEIGNGGTNAAEDRAHFSLWCMMAAPLMAGNDIRSMSTTTKEILTNKEAIAVDQDSLGLAGKRITSGNTEVWVRKLCSQTSVKKDTNYAVLFFNRSNGGAANMSVSVNQISQAVGGGIADGKVYTVRDLWGHKDLGEWTAGTYSTPNPVPAHDVFMIRLTPEPEVVAAVPVAVTTGREGIQVEIGRNIVVSGGGYHQTVSVTMVDLKGAAVYARHGVRSGKCSIRTAGIPKGVYFVKVLSGRESGVQKVVLR